MVNTMRLLALIVICVASSYSLTNYIPYNLVLLGLIASASTVMLFNTILFIAGHWNNGK